MRRQKINKISSLYYVVEVRRTTKITNKNFISVFPKWSCLKILSTVGMETIPEKTALKELGEQAMAKAEEKEVKAAGIKVRAAWFL